jgi:CubicO group peptidase (beta-lactamase class C family)
MAEVMPKYRQNQEGARARRREGRVLSAFVLLALTTLSAESPGLSTADTKAIDAVFADYDKPGSPGCMLGVVASGEFIYTRGYGRANVEHDIAFTPETVFDIGSTSKQVLATSILLLVDDGKLSLDDDVRKYLPEVPDYGATITIRHLLTHTSGLRDYITLMTLAGWQMEDVTTPGQALDLVSRQKGLDFPPGAEFAYSNTGFFLASLIVERVSGKGLAAFAAERIFQPAGMSATRYMDDHAAVVPHRATGYEPSGTDFRVASSNWEQLGDGAVQTSIADLRKWDANFYAPRVGSDRLIQALQTEGRLGSGKPIGYGLGLFVGQYRGLRTVRHGGSWAGYRAELLRVPGEKTSVMVLCNLATADPEERANRVIDIVLRGRLTEPAPRPGRAGPDPDTRALTMFGGTYWNEDRMLVARFAPHERGLAMIASGQPRPLEAVGEGLYRVHDQSTRLRFVAGTPRRVERVTDGGDPVVLVAQEPWTPSERDLDRYVGTFFSEELQARWQIARDGQTLIVRDLRAPARVLAPAFRDVFTSSGLVVKFDSGDDAPAGFAVGAGRARGMRFTRR